MGTTEGSLLRFLDQAASPAGRRTVRAWLVNPLYRRGCCSSMPSYSSMHVVRLGYALGSLELRARIACQGASCAHHGVFAISLQAAPHAMLRRR